MKKDMLIERIWFNLLKNSKKDLIYYGKKSMKARGSKESKNL